MKNNSLKIMKINCRTLIVSFIVGAFSLLSKSYAAEICPQINCDCGALPLPSWQQVCTQHETRIKKACVQNQNTPKDFCSLHGFNATPLPFTFTPPKVRILPESDIKETARRTETSMWSLQQDVEAAKERIRTENFSGGLVLLKKTEEGMNNLLAIQAQVGMSWETYERDRKASKAWEKYGEEFYNFGEYLEDYAQLLWKVMRNTQSQKMTKAYRAITFRVLRMAGKAYESSGYAYGQAGRHENAANAWKTGANLTNTTIAHRREIEGESAQTGYYRYQAAARLHRASVHWVLESSTEDAKNTLKASQLFMGRDKHQLDKLVEEEILLEEKKSILDIFKP